MMKKSVHRFIQERRRVFFWSAKTPSSKKEKIQEKRAEKKEREKSLSLKNHHFCLYNSKVTKQNPKEEYPKGRVLCKVSMMRPQKRLCHNAFFRGCFIKV
jgi:hypothetical protein